MNTIGRFLKDLRLKRHVSFETLEEKTKIKTDFLKYLESEEWNKLPEYPVVMGFVKNIAKALGESDDKAAALLRRDYPPKTLPINPKPDVSGKFIWNPKLSFIIGGFLIIATIAGYLIFQYFNYISPPNLIVLGPKTGEKIVGSSVIVSGETEPDATIVINNQPVIVDDNGKFLVELPLNEDTKEIVVTAKSRNGKETKRLVQVEVEQ